MRSRLVLLLSVLLSLPVSAMDLLEAWQQALANDPELAAARLNMKISQEAAPQARAALLPSISAGATTESARRDIQGAFTEDFNNHGWAASLTQPLFRPAEWFDLKQAGILGEQAEAEFAVRQQALILRVAGAYFEVLRARENLSSSQAEEAAVKSHLERTEERFDVGMVAMTEVHEARAAYDAAKVSLITDRGIVDIRRESLEALVGGPVAEQPGLDPDFVAVNPDPMDREAWVETALAQNLSLQAARLGVDVAEQGLGARRAEYLPTVDFVASYDRTVQGGLNFLGGKVNNQRYTLNLEWPLYLGGLRSSRVREAGYRLDASRRTTDSLQRDVREDIRVTHRKVATSVLNISALNQAIISARAALEATEAGYEVGTRNTVDVLDARRALFAAQRDYANARTDYILNLLQLKLAAGILGPADLKVLNESLL